MNSVTLPVAKEFVVSGVVSRACITWLPDCGAWKIVLLGRNTYTLRSARQNPRQFTRIETARAVVHELGMRHCELDWGE